VRVGAVPNASTGGVKPRIRF